MDRHNVLNVIQDIFVNQDILTKCINESSCVVSLFTKPRMQAMFMFGDVPVFVLGLVWVFRTWLSLSLPSVNIPTKTSWHKPGSHGLQVWPRLFDCVRSTSFSLENKLWQLDLNLLIKVIYLGWVSHVAFISSPFNMKQLKTHPNANFFRAI